MKFSIYRLTPAGTASWEKGEQPGRDEADALNAYAKTVRFPRDESVTYVVLREADNILAYDKNSTWPRHANPNGAQVLFKLVPPRHPAARRCGPGDAVSYVLTDARYDRVLAFINKLRAEHKIGKPLKRIPRGDVSSFHKCPIATALIGGKVEAAGVDDSSITLWTYNYLTLKNKVDVQTPNYVSAFINAFDEGACTRLRKLAKANV